ncbi:MAG: DUF1564 family protein [Leptospiraceae bacterium]|nr:DUF1564 family protein [Leptospiraceae bacterium]
MRVFTNNNQTNYCKNLNEPCSTSRFLIPEIHMELLEEKLTKHDNSLTNYLSYLLNRYRFFVKNGLIPKHEYLKTSYQEKDLNLKKVDFVPKAEDWAELKCLRSFFNRSMTSIFVFLLLLDALDLHLNLPKNLADFVVPKISHFRQEVRIQFSRKKFLYSKIFRMTRDKAG